ncbi:MAG: zinc ribbon-containing protein [Sulfuriferula multivorans]|uniref:Zinc ribbon-containing protein n=1 Tax=Sulfuriferula multivorans TaxID=1559896 RepID=A0A7C9P9R0_9PROT|nr:zinc ribbon-containing protein [Sulfuriferula multivorans]
MKHQLPSSDTNEPTGEAYERVLETLSKKAHQGGAFFHDLMDDIRGDLRASGKLGEAEMGKLKKYVERDLVDAAQYRDKTGKEFKYWLGFDLDLIESALWENFTVAADKTTVELAEIKLQAEIAEYHTGELTGMEALLCDQCGEKLHFHKPGHIPPCPKCNSIRFHRQSLE